MIFAKTYELVLAERKRQTCRLAYFGDRIATVTQNKPSGLVERVRVETAGGRRRWQTGSIYAVQPERCHEAVCRIRVTSLREIADPTAVGKSFAKAEGFDTLEEFLRVWHELHPKQPVQRTWVIGFELENPCAETSRE